MGFNSAFKGLKLLKTPGNGRLNNLNDPVLNVLITVTKCFFFFPNFVKFEDVAIVTMKSVVFLDMTRYNPVQMYRFIGGVILQPSTCFAA